jgi:hypothetical protein
VLDDIVVGCERHLNVCPANSTIFGTMWGQVDFVFDEHETIVVLCRGEIQVPKILEYAN